MGKDDKVRPGFEANIDHNVNTRDQNRVGIIFLVLTALTLIGLMSLGDSHAPAGHGEQVSQEPPSAAVPANQPPAGSANPPHFDINRPQGVIEWPGMVGQKVKYLSGQGNTPADQPQQGVSPSGATPSDAMPTQGSPTAAPGGH